MAILHVRFGSMLNTATPAASKLICAAAEGAFERRTPEGSAITNSDYEGDWDADIEGEPAELTAHWVTRVWMDSSIEEDVTEFDFWTDGGDEDAIEADSLEEAAEIASKKISKAQWADGAWGIVRDQETGDQMDVPSRCSHNWLGGYCDLCGAIKKA